VTSHRGASGDTVGGATGRSVLLAWSAAFRSAIAANLAHLSRPSALFTANSLEIRVLVESLFHPVAPASFAHDVAMRADQ
jgi:hypothetical protein